MAPARSSMDDYDYDLPAAAIAQTPVEPRDAARLLDATGPMTVHRTVRDLPEVLEPGDLLVVNSSRVLRARLPLVKATGGWVEVLLLEPLDDQAGGWAALVRPGRRVPPGTVLDSRPPGTLQVTVGEVIDGEGGRRVWLDPGAGSEFDAIEAIGEAPLPPYITEPLADPERYQTVFADAPGSVAAPTAGLHLTDQVLQRCRDRGIEVATVDLAVGLATFRPVTADRPEDHVVHTERFRVPPATLAAVERASRVVAVGTTSVRALESAARGLTEGRTDLFIHGDHEWRWVDLLLTNFHMPRSSLLLLVASFVGHRWRDLYTEALAEGYRFLSFGDAMLLARGRTSRGRT